MVDPFSITGTAVSIVSLGLQVCQGIIEYYSQWKGFDSDVKSTREMILHLSSTLELLQIKLKTDLLAQNATTRQIESIVEACEESIRKLQKRTEKIKSTKLSQALPVNLLVTKSEKLKTNLNATATHLQLQGQRLLYPFQQGTLGKLRDTVAELRAQLEPALLLLNLDVTTDTLSEVRELRAERHAWRAEKDNQKVFTWLSPLEFAARQHSILAKHYLGTADWFLKSPAFIAWSEASAGVSPRLWCQGQMGTGKSVLAAAVIEHLKTTFPEEAAVIYLYCDWQDSRAQSLCGLLGSLIRQCVERCSTIPPVIRECFTRHKNGKMPLSESDIPSLIEGIRNCLKKVYIVVDGLDECVYDHESKPGPSRMVALEGALDFWLSNSSVPQSGTTQLFVTSRFGPQESIKARFKEVEIRATENDIRKVVLGALLAKDWTSPWASAELGLAVQDDRGLQEQITQLCVDHADGMFLIPQLYLAHLKSMANGRQLRRAMEKPPKNLTQSISACLGRIDNQSPSMQQLGRNILMWLCYSLRPMHVRELQHALNVELDDEDFVEDGVSAVSVLITSCAGLINLESGTDVVRFVNSSIKEHLGGSERGSIPSASSHQTITNVCATYLSFRCFDIHERLDSARCSQRAQASFVITQEMVDAWFIKYPFLRYAARYWTEHTVLALETSVAKRVCVLLSDDQKATFLYVAYYATISGSIEACPKRVKSVHVAACCGLSHTTSLLLKRTEGEKQDDLANCTDSFGRTPLWLAAARGYTNIISELLASGASVSGRRNDRGQWQSSQKWWFPAWARDDYTAEALEVAAEGGHSEIVSQLLKAGGRYNRSTGIHGGPLEAAVFKGNAKIVEVLLAAGAPIKRAAIQASVYGGNERILRMLLERVSESKKPIVYDDLKRHPITRGDFLRLGDVRSTYSPTSKEDALEMALYAAALANRVTIAKALLDHGINVNAVADGFHGTALVAASAHGHVDMVELLLDTGAQVNQILPKHEFPNKSSHNTPDRRQDRSANRPSGRHGTALQAAAFAGSFDIVRILLSHGADVNAPSGYFGTALQTTSICGNLEIVNMLLDRNASLNTSSGLYGNPAQAAAFNGHSAILKRLIDAGADVNLKGGKYGYSIVAAAAASNLECLQLLIDGGAETNSTTENAGCAMRAASHSADSPDQKAYKPPPWARIDSNKSEIEVTTELDDFVKFAENPRSLALCQGQFVFGNYAGRAAQEIFQPDVSRSIEKPTHHSQNDDSLACVRLLLKHGADPNIVDRHFEPPLISAISERNLDVVKELLDGGAHISTVLSFGADSAQNPDQVVLDRETYVLMDNDGELRGKPLTALSTAVVTGSTDVVRHLLSEGADVNERNIPGGRTLLHLCHDSSMLALLIEHGATIDSPNQWSSTALHYVARYGSSDMVRMLVEAGANVSMCNKRESTPLHEAMTAYTYEHGLEDLKKKTEMLLHAGADPNARNHINQTPLDLCDAHCKELLLLLLQSGMDTSAQTDVLNKVVLKHTYDDTPADLEVAQWLVYQGTDLNTGTFLDLSADEASFAAARERRDAERSATSTHDSRPPPDAYLSEYQICSSVQWYEENHPQDRSTWNVLVSLAVNGPDDLDRLNFLIRNGIDLQQFGANALLCAVRNDHGKLANCLLDHGVSVTPMDVKVTLWKRIKVKFADYRRYVDDKEIDDYVLDEERLYEEIRGNRTWNQIYERVSLAKEEKSGLRIREKGAVDH